jgi:hypothetical protein
MPVVVRVELAVTHNFSGEPDLNLIGKHIQDYLEAMQGVGPVEVRHVTVSNEEFADKEIETGKTIPAPPPKK